MSYDQSSYPEDEWVGDSDPVYHGDPVAPARGCLYALLITGVFVFILALIVFLLISLH